MSQTQGEKPKVEAGEEIITCCPFCRTPYDEPVPCLVKITCPEEVGCGKTFLVRKY